MILGPDGKPARPRVGNTLMRTPDWMFREFARVVNGYMKAAPVVLDARGQPVYSGESRVGNTITVRKPERFSE